MLGKIPIIAENIFAIAILLAILDTPNYGEGERKVSVYYGRIVTMRKRGSAA